ncbi:hypothetical protein [Parasphingorhabdus cellanae]|uniref:Uncharacterized protein n=1 Tax=Parasphingorhabdus cellanae TaxID=2806553 RepID=A0ABX7T4W9_9SPHN|nr:hypothetical protein [Parasphingorhabdus cellanae]QTD56646.1 hypothetical protein J4G78_03380 [Parasphingorhabdus cellanae]
MQRGLSFSFAQSIQYLCFFLFSAIASQPVLADSWAPPGQAVFESDSGAARVTIIPRDLSSPLEYFRDKLDERKDPGLPPDASIVRALAVIEMKDGSGNWLTNWEVDLVNEVAPVTAILSDDGQYLVTFDNWHSVGYGPATIVRYKRGKGLLGAHDLESFLPPYYLQALPRSVSSRSWKKGDPVFDHEGFKLAIISPVLDSRGDHSKVKTVEFKIDLDSGYVSKSDTDAWIDAMLSALAVQKSQLDWEANRIEAELAPLIAKYPMTERDWHHYMREAWFRMIEPDDISATKHLRPVDHADYQKSVQWIKDEFAEMVEGKNETDWIYTELSIASSDQQNLLKLLSAIAADANPGDFRWGRALIVIEGQYWHQLKAAFKHTDIKLHFADPKKAIPSSPQRLKILFNPDPREDDEFDFLKDL